MVDVKQVIENFQTFRGSYNINSVVAGLLLKLVENGNNSGGAISIDPLIWSAIASGTANTTAADILPADSNRKGLIIHVFSAGTLLLNFGADASVASRMYVLNEGDTLIEKESFVSERLSAIAVSGTVNYTVRVAN